MKNLPSLNKNASNDQKVIYAVANAYATKDNMLIKKLEGLLLPEEITLPEDLQAQLETFGNNPIEEPKLFEALSNNDYDKFRALCLKDKSIDDVEVFDLHDFAVAVEKRITEMVDKDGVFKSTKNTEELKLPKSSQLNALNKIIETKEDEQINFEKLKEAIFETAGMEQEKLSDWEQGLVAEIYYSFIRATNNSIAKKQAVDRSPFAGYLKN